jgi:predicted Rossmann-fold nucleotide-binding protein
VDMGEGRDADFAQRVILHLCENAVAQLREGLHQDARQHIADDQAEDCAMTAMFARRASRSVIQPNMTGDTVASNRERETDERDDHAQLEIRAAPSATDRASACRAAAATARRRPIRAGMRVDMLQRIHGNPGSRVTKENDTTNLSGNSGWVLFRKMVRQPQSPTISRNAAAKRTNRVMHNPSRHKEKRLRRLRLLRLLARHAIPPMPQAARELGTLLAANGFSLVFGGGNIGLMGEVARAARAGGAPVIGILPAFLKHLEPPLKSAEELIITPDLQQRKARMLALADAFVILPGGLGTLDEYFEVLTSAQLHVLGKPIVRGRTSRAISIR